MSEAPIHAFEKAGLGRAPFRCVAVCSLPSPSLAEQNPAAYAAALADLPRGVGCGSCQFCGTAIIHNFVIESADDRRFVVGSDCVAKTGDAGLVKQTRTVRLAVVREARAASRKLKADERQALWAAERADRAREFAVTHAALIERTARYMSDEGSFIHDVMTKHIAGCRVSDKALAIVERLVGEFEAADLRRINSKHTGTVGKRYEFAVTVVRKASFTRPSFATGRDETVWVISMVDAEGNTIVSKTPNFCADKGERLVIKATIKEHGDYRGEKQTIVQRIKVLSEEAVAA